MQADLDDTMTAVPVVEQAPAEPDVEHTVIPGQVAAAVDPHMWPVEVSTGSTAGAGASAVTEAVAAPIGFYGFRIGNSEVVLLDAVVYIGRKPSAPRVVRGGHPRLVRVQSPTQEVSSTHLELRQVGSTVVIEDLKSTNGTVVAVPGLPVRALRPGESLVVTVGTLVDIGDRNVIEILPLRQRP